MRVLAGVLVALTVIAGCGDGDEDDRPKASARPELTAEQIAEALDRLYPSSGQEGPRHRALIVQRSLYADGTQDEATREEVTFGEDTYTKHDDGHEVLVYRGQVYTRTSPSGKWLTQKEAGFGLLEDYFDNLIREFESTPGSGVFDPQNLERLPDEFVGKRHAIGVRVLYELDEELSIFTQGFEGLPTVSPAPPAPDRAEMEVQFWVDADTLEPLRMESEYISFLMDRQLERIIEETTYSDFNEIDELPVQLPERDE